MSNESTNYIVDSKGNNYGKLNGELKQYVVYGFCKKNYRVFVEASNEDEARELAEESADWEEYEDENELIEIDEIEERESE